MPARRGARKDPSGRVGRVAEVAGDVRTIDADGAWVALPRNQPLSTGDRVITDKDGRATIQIGSSTVRVGAYSNVSVTRLDDQKIFLHFDHGRMAVRVRSTDILGELAIETDEGLWVPHHPGYYRFDREPGRVLAAQAWTGDMLLEAPDSSLPVKANQRVEVWREGANQTTHYRMVPPLVDAFSDWALVQDRLDDRYAAEAAAANAAVPAEMTGGADLSRYGQWSSSSDYGEIWTPNDLPPGWQPYQDGYWVWIAPWGWTWVDASPWGFAPFHYGRWVAIRGRWCWSPGHWVGRPVYAPALVGWLGGPGLAVGGAPAVGWVALAPGEVFYPGYVVSPRYWSHVNGGSAPPSDRLTIQPVKDRPLFVPAGPVAYANRRVPGAVAVVAQSSLVPHAPVAAMPEMRRPDRRRFIGDAVEKTTMLPPPAPPSGRSTRATTTNIVPVHGVSQMAPPAVKGAAAPALVGPAVTAPPARQPSWRLLRSHRPCRPGGRDEGHARAAACGPRTAVPITPPPPPALAPAPNAGCPAARTAGGGACRRRPVLRSSAGRSGGAGDRACDRRTRRRRRSPRGRPARSALKRTAHVAAPTI